MRSLKILAALATLALVGATPLVADADDRGRYAPPFTPQWAAPQLDLSPEVGGAGTQVVIRGTRFHKDVGVYFGDQPMPIIERGDRYLVAVIPPYARGDDYIYVVDNTGRARTFAPFQVVRHGPYRYYRDHGRDYRDRDYRY
ncbi:MAG: IPT/TIG domain-containing protein [Deltaproteobacteria bacterium]|nr:IPT/TIG domain-containing protein [Deltaproteobacteria bacterium]